MYGFPFDPGNHRKRHSPIELCVDRHRHFQRCDDLKPDSDECGNWNLLGDGEELVRNIDHW